MNGTCKGDRLLRNQLLRKELLAVLCSMFWFWFLSFSFPSLFVCDSFGHPHNNWCPPCVFGSSIKPRMSTRRELLPTLPKGRRHPWTKSRTSLLCSLREKRSQNLTQRTRRSWPNCANRLKIWPEPRRGSWQYSMKLRSKNKKLKSLA
jgi:hypothetical protein